MIEIHVVRFKSLMPQEKKRHFEEGSCIYCEELGHKANSCIKKKYHDIFKTRRTTIKKPSTTIKQRDLTIIEAVSLNEFKSQGLFPSGQSSCCFNVPAFSSLI